MFKLVVLSCLLAAASAVGLFAPVAPLAYAAPFWQPGNYRGPWSLAPGQPANVLAADGRPLDTLDVNVDRAAHFTAKVLNNGYHVLKKRSIIAPFVAPLAYAAPYWQPYNYRGPLSLAPGQPANILGADGRPLDTLDVNLDRSAHLTAKALSGAHILKKRSLAVVAPAVSTLAVARAPLIASHLTYAAPFAHYTAIPYTAPVAHIL